MWTSAWNIYISNIKMSCVSLTKVMCSKLSVKQPRFLSLSLPYTQTLFRFGDCSSKVSTIYALSSGYGKCGVAVIRISGPKASEAIIRITQKNTLPQPRHAVLRVLKDPVTHETLDKGLVLWFPGPKSFTGEDTCEFQVHGGPAVVSAILTALNKLSGFRPAVPGEFTKRAFHAGKLDLTEVEGLGDLIHAETEAQRKQAFLQMEGNLRQLYDTWRGALLKSIAHVEAYIDFSEDENIEENVLETMKENLRNLRSNIQKHLDDGRCGEILRDGVKTVILGEPNVGKSSLLNILCQRPAAIVTPISGTTRDVIQLNVNIGGYPVIISDTAGLRSDTEDLVEKEGILRAHDCAEKADLIVIVIDVTKYIGEHLGLSFGRFLSNYIRELKLESVVLKGTRSFNNSVTEEKKSSEGTDHFWNKICHSASCIVVLNKTDIVQELKQVKNICKQYEGIVALSCKTEDGVPEFLEKMTRKLTILCGEPSRENPCLTQARHRRHLTNCVMYLDEYFKNCSKDDDIVLAAQKLRKALREIAKITGHVSTEQILDIIFKDFCIGK